MFSGVVLLFLAKSCGVVEFPGLSRDTFSKVWLGHNLLFGTSYIK